ncbi:MAG: peptide deformylase [Bacillota bacterium]|nr:peptide deformylase [Bacillota bacterium]
MSKKKIFTIGAQELRMKANPITKFDGRLGVILRDMADTMYQSNGIGLAAPQVGIQRRMAVVDVGDGLIELINPEITSKEGECGMAEGCLSVPGRSGFVVRPEKITVKAQDRTGKAFTLEADGLLARCIQHELDHLDGILYVDKMEYEIFPEDEEDDDPTTDRKSSAGKE